jgi:hypothetical protein
MSGVQWLGIWAMTGVPKPKNSDLNKWSTGIIPLLNDSNGVYYFQIYLNETARDFGNEAKVLTAWKELDAIEWQG